MKNILMMVCACFLSAFPLHPVWAAVLDIQEITSPKGVSAWLVEDHSVPVIAVSFSFLGAGAVNDGEAKQGLSQMLSNTLDEGAGPYNSQQFQKALNDYAITLHFSSSRDDFGGSLKTLSANKDKAFELLNLSLTVPHFDAEAVARMAQANMSRIRGSMTDPEWMAARLTNAIIYDGHPYALNSGGTLATLAQITPDDLRAKLKDQMGRDRLKVAVAGDITPDELRQVLDRIFGALPASSHVADVEEAKIPEGGDPVLFKKDIPQSVVTWVIPGISIHDPDYPAAEILNYILGGAGFGSRLMEEVREKRGLTYGIYSDLSELKNSSVLTVGCSTKNSSVGDVLSITQKVIEGVAQKPVSKEEVRDARANLIGSVLLGLTSTDRIADALLSMRSLGLPVTYFDERITRLNNVSEKDVLRVAQRLFDRHVPKIILVGAPEISHTVREVSTLPNVE